MSEAGEIVANLHEDHVAAIVDVLCESFFDYPAMRFVLAADPETYERHLRKLVHFFVKARILRAEFLVGVRHLSDIDAVALVSRSDQSGSSPQLAELREQVWGELGTEARERYEAFGAACAPFQPDLQHLHLNMIGVRRKAQGKGLARRLLEHVHLLSRQDTASRGVTLTTEDEVNLSFYEHMGYRLVGHARVASELETWGFFRPD